MLDMPQPSLRHLHNFQIASWINYMNDSLEEQISNNGLARLFSIEFMGGVAGFLLTIGTTYGVLSANINENAEKNIIQDKKLDKIEENQNKIREDIAEIKSGTSYQLENQRQIRSDINRILDILEDRKNK